METCEPDATCLRDKEINVECIDGTCGKSCVENTDCPTGYACKDGRCGYATPGQDTQIMLPS